MKTLFNLIFSLISNLIFSLVFIGVLGALILPSPAQAMSCSQTYTRPLKNYINKDDVKLVKNEINKSLKGQILVISPFENSSLSIPEAIARAKVILKNLPDGALNNLTQTRLVLTEEPAVNIKINSSKNQILVYVPTDLKNTSQVQIQHGGFSTHEEIYFNSTYHLKKTVNRDLYISGLISISAEPPEAFFATSTRTEMTGLGFRNTHSDQASTWAIRTPDTRSESVFKYLHPSKHRENDLPYDKKFLVATGLGPENNPASSGFKEADLLISGDEQKGVLATALSRLESGAVQLSDFSSLPGTVVKLNDHEILINGMDQTWTLTKKGFSSLETKPEDYRQIISEEYDSYLASLFEGGKKSRNKVSYLLSTSRGCSQGCAICCSGGLSPFQFFTADRIVQDLQKIQSLHPAEKQIDIFFLDSNFNNNPSRVIELAEQLESLGLLEKFHFSVRHNTLNGFLIGKVDGPKSPNLELIKAYQKLGITQIMMGIDAYDNSSAMTLKSNRRVLSQKGAAMRPIYTYEEISTAIETMTRQKVRSRGFLLTNNPFVSDLDRVDSYYNLFLIWSKNPLFSVDVRNQDVIRLKPFGGSAIGTAAGANQHLIKDGRFQVKTEYGELDEKMDFTVFNEESSHGRWVNGLQSLLKVRASVLADAKAILQKSTKQDEQERAKAMLEKIRQRDLELIEFLNLEARSSSDYQHLISQLQTEDASLPAYNGDLNEFQKYQLEIQIQPLVESLKASP